MRYVIIGTAAVKNPVSSKMPAVRLAATSSSASMPKTAKVATDGWSKAHRPRGGGFGQKVRGWGVESIIYTDIGRDGMLSGINIEATSGRRRR